MIRPQTWRERAGLRPAAAPQQADPEALERAEAYREANLRQKAALDRLVSVLIGIRQRCTCGAAQVAAAQPVGDHEAAVERAVWALADAANVSEDRARFIVGQAIQDFGVKE